jgi:hypothetical protein
MITQITLLSLLYAVAVYGLAQPSATVELSSQPTTDADNSGLKSSLAVLSCAPDASPEMSKLTRLLPKVLENAKSISKESWEIGSLTQALLVWSLCIIHRDYDSRLIGRKPMTLILPL